jgi:hypothetical protein
MSQAEPGLISRRFGSRRDGRQEVIEVWDVTVPGCLVVSMDPKAKTVTRSFWIPGIAESSVRLYEGADAQV